MNLTWAELIRMIIGGGLISGVIAWVRFRKKDTAQVSKVLSETQIDLAEASNKRIDDEVKISKAALEWTVQLAQQLEKANVINEKRQDEIDRLHTVMQQMRIDFEKRMTEMEDMLELNQVELESEKKKNRDLLDRLNAFINGGK